MLHPKVKEFWEKRGCRILFSSYELFDFHYILDDGIATIAILYKADHLPDTYYWNNEKLSEAEMLRIVKLEAFL